jgi:hypothetical protein
MGSAVLQVQIIAKLHDSVIHCPTCEGSACLRVPRTSERSNPSDIHGQTAHDIRPRTYFNTRPPVRSGLLAGFSKLVLKALANDTACSTFEVNIVHIKVCLDIKALGVYRHVE